MEKEACLGTGIIENSMCNLIIILCLQCVRLEPFYYSVFLLFSALTASHRICPLTSAS